MIVIFPICYSSLSIRLYRYSARCFGLPGVCSGLKMVNHRRCRLLCFGLPAWVQSSHFLSPLNPFLVDPVECFFIGNGRIEVIALVVSVFKQSFDRGVRSLDSLRRLLLFDKDIPAR